MMKLIKRALLPKVFNGPSWLASILVNSYHLNHATVEATKHEPVSPQTIKLLTEWIFDNPKASDLPSIVAQLFGEYTYAFYSHMAANSLATFLFVWLMREHIGLVRELLGVLSERRRRIRPMKS